MSEENITNDTTNSVDVNTQTRKRGRPKKHLSFPSKLVCTHSGKVVLTNPQHLQKKLDKENKTIEEYLSTFICCSVQKKIRKGELAIDKNTGKVYKVQLSEPKKIGFDIDIDKVKIIRPVNVQLDEKELGVAINPVVLNVEEDGITIPTDTQENVEAPIIRTDDEKITSIEVPVEEPDDQSQPKTIEDVWNMDCDDGVDGDDEKNG